LPGWGLDCLAAGKKRNRVQKWLIQGASQSWTLKACFAFSPQPRLGAQRAFADFVSFLVRGQGGCRRGKRKGKVKRLDKN
ncbi:hypothetical protein D478_16419, partial [Brevibacillus agri BAB-2500]